MYVQHLALIKTVNCLVLSNGSMPDSKHCQHHTILQCKITFTTNHSHSASSHEQITAMRSASCTSFKGINHMLTFIPP